MRIKCLVLPVALLPRPEFRGNVIQCKEQRSQFQFYKEIVGMISQKIKEAK